MNNRRTIKPLTLFADAATGLALFLLVTGVLSHVCIGRTVSLSDVMPQAHAAKPGPAWLATDSWAQPRADTIPLAMITKTPGQVFRSTDRTSAFMILGAVFTLLFVGNVALYRHLRSQYSRPRRPGTRP